MSWLNVQQAQAVQQSRPAMWQTAQNAAWQQHQQQQQQQQQQPQASILQQQAATPRQPSQSPVAAASFGQAGLTTMRYVVLSRAPPDKDQAVIRTLTGEYIEAGENHGKKVYKKDGLENVDVYMYYWDGRDGPNFQGWWFGNQVGGTQVWSHNGNFDSMTPPAAGWKIPWDGPVSPYISVVPKMGPAAAAASSGSLAQATVAASLMASMAFPAASAANFKGLESEIAAAVSASKQAMEQTKVALSDQSNTSSMQQIESSLANHVATLAQALRKVTESRNGGATPDMLKQLAQMAAQIRSVQQLVNLELGKVRVARTKADNMAKQKEAEIKDMTVFAELKPEAEQRTNAAEDAVEKAVITAELINAAGEDLEEVRNAVGQTETVVQEAMKIIGEARIYLNAKQAVVRKFESQSAQQQAGAVLGQLQKQLQEAQLKLNPFKTVRQDFQQRQVAQKLVAEVLDKLGPAELDVDRAEEANAAVATAEDHREAVQNAEHIAVKANSAIGDVLKLLEMRKKLVAGAGKDELTKLEERCRASQKRLADIREQHKEHLERAACETILSEAAQKLESVNQAIAKAAEAENPFLMGVEQLPIQDTLAAVQACETAVSAANAAISIARMFLATRSVEAKRFSKGPSGETLEKLRQFQEQLEVHIKRFNELKANTANRKKDSLMREADVEVTNAENGAQKVVEAAGPLEDEELFKSLSAEEVRKAAEATQKAEVEANALLAQARKFITARQIEAKGKDMSSTVNAELVKYQTRLSQAQAQVAKYKKMTTQMEHRVQAKVVVDDAVSKIVAAETAVDALSEIATKMTETHGDGEEAEEANTEEGARKGSLSAEVLKDSDVASASATTALKVMQRFLDAPRPIAGIKEELDKLQARAKAVQDRFNQVTMSVKETKEKLQVRTILEESEQRLSQAEANMKKVSEAQAELLASGDDMEAASKALASLDEALANSQTSVGATKTLLAMKRLAVKRLDVAGLKESTTEALAAMEQRLDVVRKGLHEAKTSIAERKAATIRKEVEAAVEAVDAKVAALTAAVEALPTSETGSDEMKVACEATGKLVAEAEQASKSAKVLIQGRKKDTQAAGEGLSAEITAVQEKLLGLQATVDKHKQTMRDQEHMFVAQKLQSDAIQKVESLEKALEEVSTLAAQFTSEDGAAISGIVVSAVAAFLRQHLKTGNKTVTELFKEMGPDGDEPALDEDKFVAYVTKLLEGPTETEFFNEEQQRTCFKQMAKPGTRLTEADFTACMRSRFAVKALVSMTDQLVVKGGKTVKRLQVGDVLLVLEGPSKEPNLGIERLKARSELDEKEGWISMSGSQGTEYLRPFSEYDERRRSMDQALEKLTEVAKEASGYIESKLVDLRTEKTGPLNETKSELQKLKPRIGKVTAAQNQLIKEVQAVEKRVSQSLNDQKKQRQEAAEKRASAIAQEEATAATDKLKAKVQEILPAAEALAKGEDSAVEDPNQKIEVALKDIVDVTDLVKESLQFISTKLDSLKGNVRGASAELKSFLTKQRGSTQQIEQRCKKATAALTERRKALSDEALVEIVGSFRSYMKETGETIEKLFQELNLTADKEVPVSTFRERLAAIPALKDKPACLDIGLERYAAGVSRLTILGMLQEFNKCIKEIAVTTGVEISKDSKTQRKLAPGEIVEVLERGQSDVSTSLPRLQCRALSDGVTGWVTIRGNQGTLFIEKCAKPYYCVVGKELKLQAEFDIKTAEDIRTIGFGEVFEVLEGPRKEFVMEAGKKKEVQDSPHRVHGRSMGDGSSGWFSLSTDVLPWSPHMQCMKSTPLQDSIDTESATAIRRLEVGEEVQALATPSVDDKASVLRLQVRASKDGAVGYATMRGNLGTAFLDIAVADDKQTRTSATPSAAAGRRGPAR